MEVDIIYQINEVTDIFNVYKKYEPLLYKICAKYQYVNKLYSLEDLISEAWIPFQYAYTHYDPTKTKFSTYLYLCTNHHLIKTVNGINNDINDTASLFAEVDEDICIGDLIEDESFNLDEILFNRELKCLLSKKLKTLKEREQHILELYYFKELTFNQIAMVYDRCNTVIQSNHNNAMRKLRRDQELQHFYKNNINENYTIR